MLATWLAYAPGLNGPFVFDDFGNLPALGAGGPVHDVPSALRYLTSGKADPTGRPIATASFLLDATNWPASPYPFKRTNLILHLVNGALLAWFLLRLGQAMGVPGARARVAAILAAALWLLSPLLVSTVLYVVQREAMLPATFMLLAGLSWLHARARVSSHSTRSMLWLVFGAGGCTLLALLCKANGAVIPLLLLVCEWALPAPADPRFRRRAIVLFGPAAAALLAWLSWLALSSLHAGVLPTRGWSINQRLITEPSILWHYLAQLWLVVPTDTSVLHDGMRAATGWTSPWYTLPAALGCLALLIFAAVARHRFPALALAIAFYFAGHVMEATSIPLELYFDHRNYLPALLIFWPLALAVTRGRSKVYMVFTAVLATALSGLLARQNASLWGDMYRQAIVWAVSNPGSPRSQAYAAQVAEEHGRHDAATGIMAAATLRFQGEPQVALTNIDVQCHGGGLRAQDLAYASDALASTRADPGGMLLNWFDAAIPKAYAGRCAALTPGVIAGLLDTASTNPALRAIPGRKQDIDHIRGQLAMTGGDIEGAAMWFNRALADQPTPASALSQAAALGAAGRPDLALAHLDLFDRLPQPPLPRWTEGMVRVHAILLERQRYWQGELTHLRKALETSGHRAIP